MMERKWTKGVRRGTGTRLHCKIISMTVDGSRMHMQLCTSFEILTGMLLTLLLAIYELLPYSR